VKSQLRAVFVVAMAQYLSVFLGAGWGWARIEHVVFVPLPYEVAGCLAVLAIGIDWLRFLRTPRLRDADPVPQLVLMILACYLAWLMMEEPFLYYSGDETFVRNVLLLTPLLLAMSPMVRWRAWLGLLGTALFFATALAMMMHNACCHNGGNGFFEHWVY
jgi:hypothetical protein